MSEPVLITSLMRALSLFRWATLAGAWIGLVLGRAHLVRPAWALVLLGAASVFTAALHTLGRVDPERLVAPAAVMVEVGLGLVLLIGDGLVYGDGRPQSLPWAWPAAGIAAAGIAVGRHWGLVVAVVVGAASLYTEVWVLHRFEGATELPLALSKVGLWFLVGGIAGPLTDRLRRAERLISLARAREEVGRELHDGVLQTLAVVQRRSGDPDLAALARDQENSLRTYLADTRLTGAAPGPVGGPEADGDVGFEAGLRVAASTAERVHGLGVQVVVASDVEEPGPVKVKALVGAVTEALNNAAKHAEASRVVVYAEPAADLAGVGLAVSVKDDGVGFDPDEVVEGLGLSRSIRERMVEVGGRSEIRSRPGRGTEVLLWV